MSNRQTDMGSVLNYPVKQFHFIEGHGVNTKTFPSKCQTDRQEVSVKIFPCFTPLNNLVLLKALVLTPKISFQMSDKQEDRGLVLNVFLL